MFHIWQVPNLPMPYIWQVPNQLMYLNKALQRFEAQFVVPTLQGFWSLSSILMGALFFGEFEEYSPGACPYPAMAPRRLSLVHRRRTHAWPPSLAGEFEEYLPWHFGMFFAGLAVTVLGRATPAQCTAHATHLPSAHC